LIRLVAVDGSFRTNITLAELAAVLRIDPGTIAKKDASNEIDPAAVLFKVAVGTLSERSKALLRKERTTMDREPRPPDLLVDEFIREDISFTLNSLKVPDDDRKIILVAISQAARQVRHQPGEKVRAIVTSRDAIESDNVDFAVGYLPLEANPTTTAVSSDEGHQAP